MASFGYDLAGTILLPPLNLIIFSGVGLVIFRSNLRACRMLAFLTLALLYVLSTPYLVNMALSRFEAAPLHANLDHPDAIVVLGGGSEYTKERLLHAARLYRQAGLPILVSGGGPLGRRDSETGEMKAVLESDFNVPVKWVEAASDSTYENAVNSADMLKGENVHSILLVTNAWHMPRASFAFRKAGFAVTESPVQEQNRSRHRMLQFLPDAESLLMTRMIMHEWAGLVWYRLVKF